MILRYTVARDNLPPAANVLDREQGDGRMKGLQEGASLTTRARGAGSDNGRCWAHHG
jgi:hypothetical protein